MNIDSIAGTIIKMVVKKEVIILLVATIIAVLVGESIYSSTQRAGATVYSVVRGPLEQQVLFSGSIVPQSRVTLSFERPGRVSFLPFDVGDTVSEGVLVASLDADTAQAALVRESSLLESEQAVLDELMQGTRQEEIDVKKAQLAQSDVFFEESTEGLVASMINAFSVADTAMERTADIFFDNVDSATPKVKYSTVDRITEINLENERLQLGLLLEQWRADIDELRRWQTQTKRKQSLTKTPYVFQNLLAAAFLASTNNEQTPDFASLSLNARNHLVRISFFFEKLSTYAGKLELTSGLTQPTIDVYITNVSQDRSNIQTALASLTAKREMYSSAQTAITVSEQQLALSSAGARAEDIAAQRAKVNAQRAAILSSTVEIEKHSLFAPQEGVVTERFVEKGELITTGTQALTLDANGAFEIEARVSELDVVLLKEGMEARVTTDAYGPDSTFEATLTRIDPAESIAGGVAGYGVILLLDESADILKAGMTANVTIEIIMAEDALVIPTGLIERTAEGVFVNILRKGKSQRTEVRTGAETIDGRVDIISGLQEGDRIVPYERARN